MAAVRVDRIPHTNAEFSTVLSGGDNPEEHYDNNYAVIILVTKCNQYYAAISVLGVPETFRKHA